jgi:soluble lytic murein transglycosylase
VVLSRFFFFVLLATCASFLNMAQAEVGRLAALASDTQEQSFHVNHLNDSDETLYSDIFALQEKGQWKRADKLIAKLDSKVLMGHVLAQRYLHPTAYRSRYRELRLWLTKYHDHPQAERIYKLAQKRRPKNALNPHRPTGRSLSGSGYDATGYASKVYSPRRKLNRSDARKAAGYTRKMKYYTRKGWTKSVKRLLRTKEVHQLLHPGQVDQARTWLAAGYYADGLDDWAYEWSNKAIKRSGRYIPQAHWIAALASWRMGKRKQAISHFEKVTTSDYSSDWMISAGAYWAARAHLWEREPEKVNRWLEKAGAYPRTFYGLLANRALGYNHVFDWRVPSVSSSGLASLETLPTGKRALALIQVGQDEMAEREFRKSYAKASESARIVMLSIAMRTNMPSFSMRLASQLKRNGMKNIPVAALYPLPKWQPKSGYNVDRALVFALMRQESGFNPKAQSYAGAKGLMQLMPGTASFVAQDRRLRWSKKLFEPETNIGLGQRYIRMLMQESYIDGDLFHMTAAWNGGPGNLTKWKRGVKHHDDPLLFIESIPSKETRIFIERVLSNLWVYRDRMGQDVPTLDAIASGQWPKYKHQDPTSVELAKK